MSVPENTNVQEPPTLLASTARGSETHGSRILANLEGRIETPRNTPSQSLKKSLVLIALLATGTGSWAIWKFQRPRHAADTIVIAALPPSGAAKPGIPIKAEQPAPPISQAATIIQIDDAAKADHPGAASSASNASGISSVATIAETDRLSRALERNAQAKEPSSVRAAPSKAAPTKPARLERHVETAGGTHSKTTTPHVQHKAPDANRHPVVTASRQDKHHKTSHRPAASDPDVDLLAVLVARTQPYSAQRPNADTAEKNGTAGDSSVPRDK